MINDAVAIVVFEIMNSDEVFGDPCDHQTVKSVPLVTRGGGWGGFFRFEQRGVFFFFFLKGDKEGVKREERAGDF